MKNKKLFVLKTLVIIVIGYFIINLLIIHPRNARAECDRSAMNYMAKRSENSKIYSTTSREIDYDFAYRSCMRRRGYENL